MKYVLGIDTSCYTSSLACVSLEGEVLLNKQVLLELADGTRGLQQSKAIFNHLKNLPSITSELKSTIDKPELVAVCSSVKPRPQKDSYMPVFVLSQSLGQVIANINNVPYYESTHQENHIMSGLYSLGGFKAKHFLVVHLSGGTTELLEVRVHNHGFDIDMIGSSLDLHAGQFVDRIGVSLGLPFPSGPHLEELANNELESYDIKYYVKDLNISFSGPETHIQRQIVKGLDSRKIARGVYISLIKTLGKWLINAVKKGYPRDVLLVGGVSSSRIIREGLRADSEIKNEGLSLYFADPQLSKDNALGTALIGLNIYKTSNV
ncbi:MAG: O-sialoglycoprotein endopeptidase [Bacillota bacterium]|jgi:N6-L-threonylcarbamoyladenine synthase|nr:O-sialoglycoprotein endopeptidase [Bacillota bacterium]